ncbi:uncharacterized protein PGTG_07571 [Puccinia graminis f. sp. tritici CRL 75-36-700-3]|uniref:tRNA (guanine(26)-N(2))-dimethyltransferase n=1 Tax=Puccinia graminis f. sp. tritici (strain CRL 75-36-700-3 / race SCCL) TaxID=418459 RepID=E3KCM2_PUCGT|nr:uncharacterized protein PGTG_07571 [Puccinia graminis f. sp. tritici CRL 75-36-700-3]EFP82174.2 hypothetical protein PGTG_07571 [Puccinia graminis f. sp. tritici CRL 75-36-700-3]
MNHIRRRLLISITLNQHHNHQARRLMSNFPEPPPGYQAHQEASTQILIKLEKQEQQPSEAFINPVQEYNRDLSISAIKAWSSIRNQELLEKKSNNSSKNQRKKNSNNKRAVDPSPENGTTDHHHQSKKLKQSSGSDHQSNPTIQEDPTSTISKESVDQAGQPLEPQVDRNPKKETQPQKFTALEALSATGLRAIRYAKEIPTLKSIIANDLSLSAVNLIKANITHNGLDPKDPSTEQAKVRVNQGDACDLMYSHRAPDRQFDVVDLDPYGTAAPFIDAAVQCVRNGGLLCVTCTDLAVLAGSAYPEKCFSNYGGSSMRAEYSHEYALRQVIHSLASSAARYGKQITPLLSLSIDFYVRIFVRVNHSPAEVKKWITNTALVYVCSGCAAFHFQPLGRMNSKPTKAGNGANVSYQNAHGPPMPGASCEECGGTFHVAGPLWSGPLHDPAFCDRLLEGLEAADDEQQQQPLKTAERIRGMVGLAKTELPEAPFFFTPAKLSGLFKCSSPSLLTVGSAILNAGFSLSRSHCQPGSIKTDAPRAFIYDLMKAWINAQAAPVPKSTKDLGAGDQPAAVDGGNAPRVDESLDGEVKNGDVRNGEVKDGGVQDGEVKSGEVKEGEVKNGQAEDEGGLKAEKVKEGQKSGGAGEPAAEISEACRVHGAKNSSNPRLMSLLSKPMRYQVDLKYNKSVEKLLLTGLKIVRYQANPTPNWGPKARALKK